MKNKLNIEDYDNFLIIQTAFIGDVALSIFFAEELKFLNPKANISFVTTPQSSELLECSEAISNVIVFDKRDKNKTISGIFSFAKEINSRNQFDIIFVIHRSFRSALLAQLIHSKYKIGFDINSLSFLLTHKIKYEKKIHEIDRNRKLFSVFSKSKSIFKKRNGLKLKITENDINYVNSFFHKNDINLLKNTIIMAPGSVWATKRWKAEYFAQLAKMLVDCKYNIILTGSKSEIELCEKIVELSGAISCAGIMTIPQTLEIIKHVKLIITNDSAPTHFASILNVSTITIFGPTSPNFGFSPLAENSLIVEDEVLDCRPCSPHGNQVCPKKHHKCMKNINPECIFEIIVNNYK